MQNLHLSGLKKNRVTLWGSEHPLPICKDIYRGLFHFIIARFVAHPVFQGHSVGDLFL